MSSRIIKIMLGFWLPPTTNEKKDNNGMELSIFIFL